MESSIDATEVGTDSLTMEENKVDAYNQYRSSMTNEEESIYSLETFARSNVFTNYANDTNNNKSTNNNDNKSSQRNNQWCKLKLF